MVRTAFYFSAAWIFESHFTGAAVTVFKQKNHLGMLRKSFEKISGRWMPDSRRGYFSRDVANGVCTGSASVIKTAKKNEETNTKEKNMNNELTNRWESITKNIPTYMLCDEIGLDTESAYLLDLTTEENFQTANEYLEEACFKDYIPIPEQYIGKKVIMEYDTNGGSCGDWFRIHGTVDEYLENARKTLTDYIHELEEAERKAHILTEADAHDSISLSDKIHEQAVQEVCETEYKKHIRKLFGRKVLDYAKTLVINLPGSCYSNCDYCIDKKLRENVADYDTFFRSCKAVLAGKNDFNEISITGGSLPAEHFNKLIDMIQNACPDAKITWNTNGAGINDHYHVSNIRYFNLHRNSPDDKKNKELFCCQAPIISVDHLKEFAKEKLCLRVTIDQDFELDEYLKFDVPLYLNRLLPRTKASDEKFEKVLSEIDIKENDDIRRRNKYLNGVYNGIPVRICMGDQLAEHIPDRYPMWLNVVIIPRR